MATSLEEMLVRMQDLTHYGVPSDTSKQNIILDATRNWVVAYQPIIAGLVTLAPGYTWVAIPANVDPARIDRVMTWDADSSIGAETTEEVDVRIDKDLGIIYFSESPTENTYYHVWGMPTVSLPWLDTVLGLVPFSCLTTLWQFVNAAYASWAQMADAVTLLQLARASALQDRITDNGYPTSSIASTIAALDTDGNSGVGDFGSDL